MSCNKIDRCLICDNTNLHLTLDLNEQPLANSYLNDLTQQEIVYPLAINFCNDCTHIQLSHSVDPDELFKHYLYVSGTSDTLNKYFDWFAQHTTQYTVGKKILDIACNDGTQLDYFKRYGFETYGIDPAQNLHDQSSRNHNVVCDYLTTSSIQSFGVKFDVIVAQNVFAHNTYPMEFLQICKDQLNEGGHIFIQTSQADMVKQRQFDTIYHEHISFFSVKSLCTLAERVGLNVIDVQRTSIHGTSFLFILSNVGKDRSETLMNREPELNLQEMNDYANDCYALVDRVRNEVNKLRQLGYKIIGYGAAAKGNTFLNFANIQLDYIVDDNPLKHNMYTPGSRIKIESPTALSQETDKVCIMPLAWNFFDEIKLKVNDICNVECRFLKYYPTVELI